MLTEWLNSSIELASEPADFYAGARKILRNRRIVFTDIQDDLTLADAGYTQTKMTLLRKGYYHEESINVAKMLWELRKEKRKYGSVAFTTYNHLLKNDPNKKSKRASVMGPCIQSVSLTYLNDHTTAVDVFYRTTEYFKKFPADLVFLRDVLLPNFDFTKAPIRDITFHFANITCHPMYFVTLIPNLPRPLRVLDDLAEKDEHFWKSVVKLTARYLVPEYFHGIEKHEQSLRVKKDALNRIPKNKLAKLTKYFEDNHPGYGRMK